MDAGVAHRRPGGVRRPEPIRGAAFLALAIAGVLARHRRATGPKGRRTARTTGSLPLAGEAEGRYTVTDLF